MQNEYMVQGLSITLQ